jgi:putative spermidine/putrescine transport system ATP-binding protein
VFNEGRIEQLDSPRALYMRPRTPFVARFVGSANVVDGALAEQLTGQRRAFAIRPELVDVVADGEPAPTDSLRVSGVLEAVQYHGSRSRWQVRVAEDTVLTADRPETGTTETPCPTGGRVTVAFSPANIVHLTDA